MLILRERLHFPTLELYRTNYLIFMKCSNQVRETLDILRLVDTLQFLFQRQGGFLAPLRVVSLGQLQIFRRAAG